MNMRKMYPPRMVPFSSVKRKSQQILECVFTAEGNNPDLTVCRQIYTEHKLLALDPEEGQLLVDSFKLPSACACFVREDFILEFRMKGESEETKDDSNEPTLPSQVEQDEEKKFKFDR